ncbi:MAG TPA: enoyl-CoA hydratase-related protein [Caulobacteraceae bacterium]|jgi:methylglutaconyl-CoA hydratase
MTDTTNTSSGEPTFADPMVEDPAPDAETGTVLIKATPEGIATIIINRPEKKNAFNQEVIGGLREAFESMHGADHVRVVFIRGAGGSFCAGADLEWMRDSVDWDEADNRDDAYQLARMLKALHDIPVLTVALVEGAAFGGGVGLAAACDVAIAVKGARFAFSEVKLGLIPATISPYVIEAIGARRARSLFSTGRVFDADFAEKIGLVQEVVADSRALHALAQGLAREALSAAPQAARDAKRLVAAVRGRTIDDHLMQETAQLIAKARTGAEGQDGVRAFMEKRKPGWLTDKT